MTRRAKPQRSPDFSVLAQGTNRVIGPVDSNAFVDYIGAHSPVAIPALDRVNIAP